MFIYRGKRVNFSSQLVSLDVNCLIKIILCVAIELFSHKFQEKKQAHTDMHTHISHTHTHTYIQTHQ